ncbi:27734_t:CDS:1, partial [Dentiscutata erythropus]
TPVAESSFMSKSRISSSISIHLDVDSNADSEEEYEPLLIFHQHSLDNLDSESSGDEKTMEANTKRTYKKNKNQ